MGHISHISISVWSQFPLVIILPFTGFVTQPCGQRGKAGEYVYPVTGLDQSTSPTPGTNRFCDGILSATCPCPPCPLPTRMLLQMQDGSPLEHGVSVWSAACNR